jgi:tripartite ATP-independent transporter DctM subunit
MDPNLATIVVIIVMMVLLALGLPIAFTMTIVGFIGLAIVLGVEGALTSLEIIPFTSLSSYLLTVVPMFILMGQFAYHSGICNDLFEFGQKWLSGFPGGLACATVAGCAMFGACTGSSLACCATMGKIAIPEMEKAGYHPRLAAGTVAGAGGLAILIPPSIAAVMYAIVSQESVGKMLIAGILPGIFSVAIYILLIALTIKLSPGLAPSIARSSWKEKLAAFRKVWGIIIIFTVVMGSIYLGLATPTEAGAVGACGTLIIVLIRRKSSLRDIWDACLETGRSLSMIFAIFIGTSIFGLFIARTGITTKLASFVSALPLPPLFVVIAIILMYVPLGMFLDPISMVLLTIPIVYPVIISLGFDGIWFGIIITIICEVGLITPPVAMNLYVVKGVAPNISMEDIIKGALPFIARDLLIIAILIMFPQIVTWLPSLMR